MHIFWCDIRAWREDPSAALDFCTGAGINPGEFLRLEDLIPHAAGRFLLKEGFAALFPGQSPPALAFSSEGKPRFPGGLPAFSISHAGDLALCAFGSSELGADIERVIPAEEELLDILRPEELAWLRRSRDWDLAFFRLWTAKESLAKAGGGGLGAALQLDSVITPALEWKTRVNGFFLTSVPLWEPEYAAAVSIRSPEPAAAVRLELPETRPSGQKRPGNDKTAPAGW